jgi:acyl carrier protein
MKRSESDIQAGLIEIWKDLLDLEAVEPDDNFIELGGNSMIAMRMLSRIKAHFGLELPTQTLFECSTVRELTGAIVDARKAGAG